MKKIIFAVFLLIPSVAHSQILWDLAASPSEAMTYGYKLYVTPQGANVPVSTVNLVGVTCTMGATNTACTAPIDQARVVGATLPGAKSELTTIDTSGGFAESEKSTPFIMQTTCSVNAVKLVIGSWTRALASGGIGQVLYSLQQSANPVIKVDVLFNGILQDELTGTRLNNSAGQYFKANVAKGTYQLTVEAFDVNNCKDGGATRPMTVTVN